MIYKFDLFLKHIRCVLSEFQNTYQTERLRDHEMAAQALIPEDELCCSVCFDIFKEPVLLKCSHSFCRVCLQQYWQEKSSRECPICRKRSSMEDPLVNLALRSIAESFLKQKTEREIAQKSEAHCRLHGEKLLLFCNHDKELLCLVCQTSRKHINHPVCPAEEAVLDLKVIYFIKRQTFHIVKIQLNV